jgi:hypothetical protein
MITNQIESIKFNNERLLDQQKLSLQWKEIIPHLQKIDNIKNQ